MQDICFLLLGSQGLVMNHAPHAYLTGLELFDEYNHMRQSREHHTFGVLCENGKILTTNTGCVNASLLTIQCVWIDTSWHYMMCEQILPDITWCVNASLLTIQCVWMHPYWHYRVWTDTYWQYSVCEHILTDNTGGMNRSLLIIKGVWTDPYWHYRVCILLWKCNFLSICIKQKITELIM